MRSRLFFLWAFVFIGTSCASQRPLYTGEVLQVDDAESLKHLNERTADRVATVIMNRGVSLPAQSLLMAADSTSWLDPSSGSVMSVKTSEIAGVRFEDRGRGAVTGLIAGVTVGTLLGVMAGLLESQGSGFLGDPSPAGEAILRNGATLGGIGGLIGLTIGSASGGEEVYRIDSQAQER